MGFDRTIFDLKKSQDGILTRGEHQLNQQGFPPSQGIWKKGHSPIDCRHIARVAITSEESGIIGCWKIIAIKRYSQKPNKPKGEDSEEIGYHISGLARQERDDAGIGAVVWVRWSGVGFEPPQRQVLKHHAQFQMNRPCPVL